jgi:nucleotidyltransferase substrate binding protein (TIGR01987 family)
MKRRKMSNRFDLLKNDFLKSIANLSEGLTSATDDLQKDGVILRFELTYELAWKVIQVYLENEGVICMSPRDCFKKAKEIGIIEDEMLWMEMVKNRNRLVHFYSFKISRKIFESIRDIYAPILKGLSLKLNQN